MDYSHQTTDQPTASKSTPFPLVIVLDNLRSAYNVGNIFRLADVCHIREIITCGYTPTPPHPKLLKTARGCTEFVACRHHPTSLAAVQDLRAHGYTIVAVETIPTATSVWETTYSLPTALVFGNEALGIEPSTLEYCDQFIQLPVFGHKQALNVANCAAIVLYDAVRQCVATDR